MICIYLFTYLLDMCPWSTIIFCGLKPFELYIVILFEDALQFLYIFGKLFQQRRQHQPEAIFQLCPVQINIQYVPVNALNTLEYYHTVVLFRGESQIK